MKSFSKKMKSFLKNNFEIIEEVYKNDHSELKLKTIYGILNCIFYEDKSSVFTVFTRFDNVKMASTYLSCNPYSGKYNFHVGATEGQVKKDVEDYAFNFISSQLMNLTTKKKS